MAHRYRAGALFTRYHAAFGRQAYNWVGVGSLDGETVLPSDPSLTDENTNRRDRSTEWYLGMRNLLGPDRKSVV